MPRIAYVSGRYVPLRDAAVSVEDRGFQFADGVYEVIALKDGRLLDRDGHMARLARSLAALKIAPPMSDAAFGAVLDETVRRNGLKGGLIYVQITRGVAARDHAFPRRAAAATVVVTLRPIAWAAIEARAKTGVRVITAPDLRWKRCDIKSVALLPNVLAKEEARSRNAQEAWLVDEAGAITEGASSNAWIVTAEGILVTRETGPAILAGITRDAVLRLAEKRGIRTQIRPFSRDEIKTAKEAFLSSATNHVMPVVEIDGQKVADGAPGPITRQLREDYAQA